MRFRAFAPLLLACALLLTAGCQSSPGGAVPPAPTVTPPPAPSSTPDPTPSPDPIAAQVSAMTTEEKVGQLLLVGFYGTEPGMDVTRSIQEYRVGGVILFGRNVESTVQLTALTNGLKALNGDGIPLFVSADQEGGLVERMPPEIRRLPNAFDVADPAALGTAVGRECAAFGINLDFAPCLDIWSNPANTVIGKRAFGEDWENVSARGFDALDALRATGVIPVVKHFPGHGDTATDSHVGLPVVEKTKDDLMLSELMPFLMVISGDFWGENRSAPVPAVMAAHILMTELDPERPASLSPAVVNGLLREELGFEGVVFTDDLTMGAVTQNYGLGEAAVMAVDAGCDVLLICHEQENIETARTALLDAVETGRISQDRLDESVYRILSMKEDHRLTNSPVEVPDTDTLNAIVDAAW